MYKIIVMCLTEVYRILCNVIVVVVLYLSQVTTLNRTHTCTSSHLETLAVLAGRPPQKRRYKDMVKEFKRNTKIWL